MIVFDFVFFYRRPAVNLITFPVSDSDYRYNQNWFECNGRSGQQRHSEASD